MTTDDLRQILGLGDLVLYDVPCFCFEGTVTKIDYETDLVTVEMTDRCGKREYDCGFERIGLLLKAAARETKTAAFAAAS